MDIMKTKTKNVINVILSALNVVKEVIIVLNVLMIDSYLLYVKEKEDIIH